MISQIRCYLPSTELTNAELVQLQSGLSCDELLRRTGISTRRVAGADEWTSDLSVAAALKVVRGSSPIDIDFLVLCTQTPDYLIPSTACIVQHALGLACSCGALDISLGCSGYIYGLAVAQSLLQQGIARHALLLTADTITKLLRPCDLATRSLFGDAGTATLLRGGGDGRLHSFVFGTDGGGADQLIARGTGMRGCSETPDGSRGTLEGDHESPGWLTMNGPEVFNFTLQRVPKLVEDVLSKAGLAKEDVDYFVLHQANAFMLEHLRRKLLIPKERFVVALEQYGNTVSSSIPLALEGLLDRRVLRKGNRVLLCGFGVGLSWAGCIWECGAQQ